MTIWTKEFKRDYMREWMRNFLKTSKGKEYIGRMKPYQKEMNKKPESRKKVMEWRNKHPERCNELSIIHNKTDKRQAWCKAYRERNRERLNAYQRGWEKRKREKLKGVSNDN